MKVLKCICRVWRVQRSVYDTRHVLFLLFSKKKDVLLYRTMKTRDLFNKLRNSVFINTQVKKSRSDFHMRGFGIKSKDVSFIVFLMSDW